MKIGLTLLAVGLLAPGLAQAETKVKKPFVLVKGKPAKDTDPTGKAETTKVLVDGGLVWLKQKQASDGRWTRSSTGKHDDEKDVIPTAQAVLAYLGNGFTHRFGTYKTTVAGGMDWLKTAWKKGWGKKSDAPVLARALAAQAIAEAYMVTLDRGLKPLVEQALPDLIAMESPQGGFGFQPKGPPNSLATALMVLTFKTFKVSGIAVPKAVFTKCSDYLRGCAGADGLTGFSAPKQGISLGVLPSKKKKKRKAKYAKVPLFTAGSLIAQIFSGVRRTDPVLRSGIKHLSVPHPDRREPLYWYLSLYGAFQIVRTKDPLWGRWQTGLLVTLTAKRKPDGSWAAKGVMGRLGGAAGATALNTQSLEIILRYERIYRGR